MEEKAKTSNDYTQEMATKMKSKFDKYWGSNNLLIFIDAVLDPRNKSIPIQFSSWTFSGSGSQAKNYVSTVRDLFN